MSCSHSKIKKIFYFGRKSKADKFCVYCGSVVTNKIIRDKLIKKHRMIKKWNN